MNNTSVTINWPSDYRNGLKGEIVSIKANAWSGDVAKVRLTDFVQLFDIPVAKLIKDA